ncbi:hypothetical protein Strvi_1131 [Streptomyces violaceusniger Tu 4113]|uniref:Uncharacterized protein n=1 Tax=Streptomyces violaceusniger (strain Tu 4113) TaxID=653045 RepID=G2P0D2_STRV4|nr:hypothetical protein Strvi_1131 [Streptomyces violaceusniger Tu 4113]
MPGYCSAGALMRQWVGPSYGNLHSVNPPGADIDAVNGQPEGTAARSLLPCLSPSLMSHQVRADKPDVLTPRCWHTGRPHGPVQRGLITGPMAAHRRQ